MPVRVTTRAGPGPLPGTGEYGRGQMATCGHGRGRIQPCAAVPAGVQRKFGCGGRAGGPYDRPGKHGMLTGEGAVMRAAVVSIEEAYVLFGGYDACRGDRSTWGFWRM